MTPVTRVRRKGGKASAIPSTTPRQWNHEQKEKLFLAREAGCADNLVMQCSRCDAVQACWGILLHPYQCHPLPFVLGHSITVSPTPTSPFCVRSNLFGFLSKQVGQEADIPTGISHSSPGLTKKDNIPNCGGSCAPCLFLVSLPGKDNCRHV